MFEEETTTIPFLVVLAYFSAQKRIKVTPTRSLPSKADIDKPRN